MQRTTIPQETIEITARFYEAVDELIRTKEIRGLGTLAKRWGLGRFSLSMGKNHIETKRLNMEYFFYLSRDYRVSPHWLFYGIGDMFL